MAKVRNKSSLLNTSFFAGFSVAGFIGIVFILLALQLEVFQTENVYAGKEGLTGNTKYPDWYTTCTGAEPTSPDQTPPTISFVSPSSGTMVSRKEVVNFRIESTDETMLNRNEMYVNGVLKGIIYSASSPYTHGWQVPPNATSGTEYKVYSKTCDQANNFVISDTITIIAK